MIQNTSVKRCICYNKVQLNTQVWCQNFQFKPWGPCKSSSCKKGAVEKKIRRKTARSFGWDFYLKKGNSCLLRFTRSYFITDLESGLIDSPRDSTISFTQLFRERLWEKMCSTRKGNNTVSDFVAFQPHFCCFPLVLANTRLWPLMPFFQISFRDCLGSYHISFQKNWWM